MHSSTSSFETGLPASPLAKVVVFAAALCLLCIALIEFDLQRLGYRSTVLDSSARWVSERQKADDYGINALAIIGASRIQLGLDLATIRARTGFRPVQLAADGSSFVPILEGLASDTEFKGTVLVDFSPSTVSTAITREFGLSRIYETAWEKRSARNKQINSEVIENLLTQNLRENLRSYSDGGTPLTALTLRLLEQKQSTAYLQTLPDRERLADYRLTTMPAFYYTRVARMLGNGKNFNLEAPDIEQQLQRAIQTLHTADQALFAKGTEHIKRLVADIQTRGGKVIFVEMPTSGMVAEIETKQYPQALFFDQFEIQLGTKILSPRHFDGLRGFTCPDGSHLDYRDRVAYTQAVLDALEGK